MWLTLAFTSAALLGFYDVAKKKSLTGNAVLPVLLLNTLFSSLVFLPALLSAECGLGWFEGTVLEASPGTLHAHGLVVLKSVIVLTSWIFGYFGMKHLPITIVGPINATRPRHGARRGHARLRRAAERLPVGPASYWHSCRSSC